MSFVHLHNHTEYSLLNGAIRIPDLVAKTKAFGMPAVAMTDYANIFGAVDFFGEAKKKGVKPIIGCTVFLPSHDQHTLKQHRRGIDHLWQMVLLITNKQGYRNLSKLLTLSCLEGFYYKPRVDTALLKEYNEGLICLSGGWGSPVNHALFEGRRDLAHEQVQKFARIFPDRFYIELQENGVEGQHATNLELIDVAKKEGIPVVATNNCHYLTREDAESFETLLCIQTGATLHGANDRLKFSTDGYYFKNIDEMKEDFTYCPEALEQTVKIAGQVDFGFDLKNYYFPKFEPPAGKTLDQFLDEEAAQGLQDRWAEILKHRGIEDVGAGLTPPAGAVNRAPTEIELRKQYETRLRYELDMIKKTGFAGYFLIVSDFIRYAKRIGIPVGPGRGSAAGSLVAYCIQITDLDPIPYDLLFERFLNPERISMPDVDIDFCMNRRDEVLQYVAKKYGNVSQIITFGKMKARAVLRDVARVMEMPYEQADKIAKLVPNALNITLEEALKQEPRLQNMVDSDPQVKRLMEIAKRLEGLNRHASTHAAGVVISDKPLTDFLPLYKGSNDDIVTGFDMKAVEKIGLIKFDFLGLKTLTLIQNTLQIIKRTRGIELNILDIPLADPEVYVLIARGDSSGVFQLESPGMRDLMVRLKPSCFEDIIALVALYRPGPLGSGMVDDFINRKHGKTHIAYDLPELKPILEETYGVIVYQEQVMRIASVLAGYSLGEADLLRRAMGKKKPEEMAAQKIRFLQGCLDKKFPRPKAEKIFDLMAKFAEYGFNKSHSAAYALVSYQTAYLKTHFTVEYMAAMLTIEMADTDRILYYIEDCKEHGIKILPPDINEGYSGFSVVCEKEIRYGLAAVKNVGQGAIEAIVGARTRLGRFESFIHLCEQIDHRKVNRRVLESLIKCGAFDSLELNRRALFEIIDVAVEQSQKKQEETRQGQTNLFGLMQSVSGQSMGLSLPRVAPWAENEKLSFEKEALGFYFSGHPLKSYQAEIRRVATTDTHLCQQLPGQTPATLAGMVNRQRVITTKKGTRMAFVTLEDLKGSVEVIVFSDVYQKCADLLGLDKPLVVTGTIDRTEEGAKILAKEVVLLTNYFLQKTQSIHFKIPSPLFTEERIRDFKNILKERPGALRAFVHLIQPGSATSGVATTSGATTASGVATETVMELPQGVTVDDADAFAARVDHLFERKVVEYR